MIDLLAILLIISPFLLIISLALNLYLWYLYKKVHRDYFIGSSLVITSRDNAGQSRKVINYNKHNNTYTVDTPFSKG